MSKLRKASIFLRNPITVIENGIRSLSRVDHKKLLLEKYGIERLPTININDMFGGVNDKLDVCVFLDGGSSVMDLLLLKLLAKRKPGINYLEIGTWRGESLSNVAPFVDKCTTINLPKEDLLAFGKSEDFVKAHGSLSKNNDNVRPVFMNSLKLDFADLEEKYDLIFVDGNHSYDGILNDSKKVFDVRRDPDSVIVWHDYGYSPQSVRHSTLLAILDGVPRELHGNLYHVSNTLCAIYMENADHPTTMTRFPGKPVDRFEVSVKGFKIGE